MKSMLALLVYNEALLKRNGSVFIVQSPAPGDVNDGIY